MATIEELQALLQASQPEKNNNLSMGLLNLGAGILANNRGHGGALGPALGAGMLQGLQGYNQAAQTNRGNRIQDMITQMKLDSLKKQQDHEGQVKQWQSAIPSATYGFSAPSSMLNGSFSPNNLQSMNMMDVRQDKPVQPTQEQYAEWIRRGMAIDPEIANKNSDTIKNLTPKVNSDGSPSFAPIQGSDSYWVFDRRTGKYTKPDGAPVAPQYNIPLQGNLAATKAAGTIKGQTQENAKVALPQNIQDAENTIKLVDDLLKHPGFNKVVGAKSMLGMQYVPGTDAKDFVIREDQLKGKQFMQAYQTLKGGGQITEVEGKKATDAISRMNHASSPEAYRQAAEDFKSIIRQGVERAKRQAGVTSDSSGGWGIERVN